MTTRLASNRRRSPRPGSVRRAQGGAAMRGVVVATGLVAGEPPQALYSTLYVLWIAVTFSLIWRNSARRCPRCDHRYLRAFPWMSLKKVECGVCGYELH